MIRRTVAIALLAILVNGGCRMCASYTDCVKPVLDGPYSHVEGRAGSILSGHYQPPQYEMASSSSEPITPIADPTDYPPSE